MDKVNVEIPEWMIELSEQLNEQPNRCTSDPFWQVRIHEYLVTESGYNEHHWELVDEDGSFYRSDRDGDPLDALMDRHPKETEAAIEECGNLDFPHDDICEIDGDINIIYMQKVERVVSTHLTEHDANWFIQRKGHDYPGAFTYVESGYYSPQIKKLREWIMSLTK